jgi:hypothetical protein
VERHSCAGAVLIAAVIEAGRLLLTDAEGPVAGFV